MAIKKTGKATARQNPVTATGKTKPIDPAIAARRRAAVTRLQTSGYSRIEIADTLLQQHINGDTTLFTFRDAVTQKPVAGADLSYEELRKRVYFVIGQDLQTARRDDAEAPDEETIAQERWLLLRRLRKMMKKLDELLYGVPGGRAGTNDAREVASLMKPAIEVAVRIARLGGIESDKPIEIRLPELYIATIDEDGVVHMTKDEAAKSEPVYVTTSGSAERVEPVSSKRRT